MFPALSAEMPYRLGASVYGQHATGTQLASGPASAHRRTSCAETVYSPVKAPSNASAVPPCRSWSVMLVTPPGCAITRLPVAPTASLGTMTTMAWFAALLKPMTASARALSALISATMLTAVACASAPMVMSKSTAAAASKVKVSSVVPSVMVKVSAATGIPVRYR